MVGGIYLAKKSFDQEAKMAMAVKLFEMERIFGTGFM